jgi:hypothetical protein
VFYNINNENLPIKNLYKNQTCFLILSGPSLINFDLNKLQQSGIITFGVNNSPKIFRPDLWTSGDSVQHFMISIYKDPKIKKFITYAKRNDHLFDNIKWEVSDLKVADCPNVVYYVLDDNFTPETYLKNDTVSWGRSREGGGCRSVMLAAVRIIYELGFRKLFILGADFKMTDDKKYAFKQDRSKGSMHSNNNAYKKLNERFNALRPIFEKNNFYIFNCYKDSGLKSFDYVPFESAVKIALNNFPNIISESTDGMYDREAKLREIEKKKTHGIIYYNVGKSYLVRLSISLSSLRKVYDGSVIILCDSESVDTCKQIGEKYKTQVKEIDFTKENRNFKLFNKTLLHKHTPFESNIFIDADTIVLKDTIGKIFKQVDSNEFVVTQFADWTPKTSIISKRIEQWKDIISINKAIEYPVAINTGVFGFKKDSKLMQDWYNLAINGESFFIPDEISCQIMLPDYKHSVMGASFNTSCKYGKLGLRTAIIHYHGNKHCRIENNNYLHNSNLWYKEFDQIRDLPFIKDNIIYDNKLTENLIMHDNIRRINK